MKGKITREELDQSLITEINSINEQLDTKVSYFETVANMIKSNKIKK